MPSTAALPAADVPPGQGFLPADPLPFPRLGGLPAACQPSTASGSLMLESQPVEATTRPSKRPSLALAACGACPLPLQPGTGSAPHCLRLPSPSVELVHLCGSGGLQNHLGTRSWGKGSERVHSKWARKI